MTQTVQKKAQPLASVDPIWTRLRDEALEASVKEPALAGMLHSTILHHDALEAAVIHRIAARLEHGELSDGAIRQAFEDAFAAEPEIGHAIRADIAAVADRDPVCTRFLEPVLYFKGFHALQAHRFAHRLWLEGRKDFALYLQSRVSSTLQVDIHPAVPVGKGVFIDHGTGIVIGETAVIEDDVSILQSVTLGGTGKQHGDRHPKIRRGVLIGAGAKILGNIEVGAGSRIAAGSVVLHPVPRCTTVAGVPARVVGTAPCAEPSRMMDHMLSAVETFDPVI
ncbi:serine O-acetyltransferase [Terrihabitans rhizophilus]|jgi:serine O-acetyltransferase|uniref:Serine acetyltransferase n=1 Tax=Terrihabitans rhizophilus TaxID=3092662 RepID=A0ABU4RS00_9HYPH|nr:serine O-acetyltransferase [Terrihabitans sp. PJ23]MDX6807627.1 serine O-acetyltransferase [Terrihabitans sp. PJ23]